MKIREINIEIDKEEFKNKLNLKDGKDGLPGKDGEQGKPGKDGKVGKPGKDGNSPTKTELKTLIKPLIPDSIPGQDGSPDTPIEIVEKINTLPLTSPHKIDASHIKNFPLIGGSYNERKNKVLWGEIKGTLSNQTDLQDALDGKTLAAVLVSGNDTGGTDIVRDSGILGKATFTIAPIAWTVTSTNVAFAGLEYSSDYSANFTSTSLINKGYADATYLNTVSDTTSVNLTLTGVNLTADVLPAGVDHNSLANLTVGNVHTQYGLVASPLSQFAATTSAQLLGVISDETGTGLAVFNTSPTFITPLLGTPTSGVLTNCTGLPAASVVAGTFGTGAYVIDTSLTNPILIGSTAAAGTLTLRATSSATNGDIIFQTDPTTEAMRILGSGYIGIGVSPTSKFHIGAIAGVNGGFNLNLLANSGTASTSYATIDFRVPTTGLIGQFLSLASNYSNASVDVLANSIVLSSLATSGQLSLIAGGSSGIFTIHTGGYASTNRRLTILSGGNAGFGVTTPTAVLHLKAGTATASTAPLKFTSGTLLTTAEALAVEALTDNLHFTITTGAARKGIMLDDGARLTSGKIPIATTNGRLIDGQTPLSGTKVYYVADTSGGAVTRKLTFIDGILTAEV